MRPFLVSAVIAILLAFLYSGRHLTVEDHVAYERIAPGVEHFVNSRSMAVHWRRLGNDVPNATALVLCVHGYQEHLGYYEDIATTYNTEGWLAYGVDHLGHGQSEGERGHVANVNQLRDDVMLFVKTQVKKLHPTLPIFVHGHSLGGMVAILLMQLDYETNRPPLFTTAYLEAPLVVAHPATGSPFLRRIARALSFIPKFIVPGTALKKELFTRNESMVPRWLADPLRCTQCDVSIGTGVAIMNSEEEIARFNPQVQWPFFLATGDDDMGCDYEGGVKFFERAATKPALKQLKVYRGLRHALKWEPESAEVKRDIVQWFRRFDPPAGVAADPQIAAHLQRLRK